MIMEAEGLIQDQQLTGWRLRNTDGVAPVWFESLMIKPCVNYRLSLKTGEDHCPGSERKILSYSAFYSIQVSSPISGGGGTYFTYT